MNNSNIRLDNINKIHMIGIGGISMSGVAVMLKKEGFNVSGSDTVDGDMVKILRNENINVFIGHNKELVKYADLVVYTAAVKDDDPELIEALVQTKNELNINQCIHSSNSRYFFYKKK